MTEQNKKTDDTKINVEELLKKQNEEFTKKQKELADSMQAKLDEMAEQNKKLTEELDNLKTNTEIENELLGEKIARYTQNNDLPDYNPFDKDILYKVKNQDAGIETLMTGDEVKGIIGAIDTYLEEKLINGAKTIEKHPYVITLVEKKQG